MCVNKNCFNNPTNSLHAVAVSIDGDMACNPACKVAYEAQRNVFLNETIQDDTKYAAWEVAISD